MINVDINNFHLLSKAKKADIFNNRPDLLEPLVKEVLKPKRYDHSLSVAEVATSLAKRHHVDIKKAYIAGILHDITKYLSLDEHLEYLKYYDPNKMSAPEPILHSYTAIYFIKEKLNYYDRDVLNAIYHHTDGEIKSPLGKILYIADKREPKREIADDILNIAYNDLNKAFELLKLDVKEYISKK